MIQIFSSIDQSNKIFTSIFDTEPGKRPQSSMSPVIVLDDNNNVFFVSGASGGPRIISSTAMVLVFKYGISF